MDDEDKHYCHCQAGYTGSYCEDEVDECSPNPCQNGATCTDYLGGFSCKVWAVPGWREGLGLGMSVAAGALVTGSWCIMAEGARCDTPVRDPVTLQMCWRRRNMLSSGLGYPFPSWFHVT